MKIITDTQRTPEWYQARVGMLCGSRAADMLATMKSGEAAARRDLRTQLVVERLTGQSQENGGFVNAEMQRGIDKEADAFAAYEALTGNLGLSVGFLAHDSLLAGCSPDGQVNGYEGILELKCPKSATHLRYLRSPGKVPSDYIAQVIHNLWITGAEWCDFASFDDRFPPALHLFSVRVYRKDLDMAAYDQIARAFLAEVERECAEVQQLALVPA